MSINVYWQELIKNKAKSGQNCCFLEEAFSMVSCLPWRSDNLHQVSLIENYPAHLTTLGEPVRQVSPDDWLVFISSLNSESVRKKLIKGWLWDFNNCATVSQFTTVSQLLCFCWFLKCTFFRLCAYMGGFTIYCLWHPSNPDVHFQPLATNQRKQFSQMKRQTPLCAYHWSRLVPVGPCSSEWFMYSALDILIYIVSDYSGCLVFKKKNCIQ